MRLGIKNYVLDDLDGVTVLNLLAMQRLEYKMVRNRIMPLILAMLKHCAPAAGMVLSTISGIRQLSGRATSTIDSVSDASFRRQSALRSQASVEPVAVCGVRVVAPLRRFVGIA